MQNQLFKNSEYKKKRKLPQNFICEACRCRLRFIVENNRGSPGKIFPGELYISYIMSRLGNMGKLLYVNISDNLPLSARLT